MNIKEYKIKKIVLIVFILGITLFMNNGIKAQTNNSIYKTGSIVLTEKQASEMIEKYGELKPLQNDIKPKGYNYFVGYNNATHIAYYTKEKSDSKEKSELNMQAQATSTKKIVNIGTWRVGSYWGVAMNDANGTPVYCGDYGKNEPIGTYSWKISENTRIGRSLSWGYGIVKSGNNKSMAQRGKTQLGLWKGQGSVNPSATTLGVYENVAKAYKGTLGVNARTFSITGNWTTSSVFNGIPNQNVTGAIKVSGTATYGFTSNQMNKMTSKGIYPYKLDSKTGKWSRMVAGVMYSTTTNTYIRLATSNLAYTGTIADVEFNTNQQKIAGYIYDNGKSGDQRIYMSSTDPITVKKANAKFKSLLGNAKLLKMMDDIDLYQTEMKDFYSTKDGKKVIFETELGELSPSSLLRYDTKENFLKNDGYDKPYTYKYLDYNHLTETKDKLDVNGDKIPAVDENGLNVGETGYIETWEQEKTNKVDKDGTPIVKAKKDANGNYVYAEATTPHNMPSKEIMNAETKAELKDGVEFTIFKADKKSIVKTTKVANGEILFNNLQPATYYIQETKTKENFNLVKTMYEVKVEVGKTAVINNGNPIINRIDYSEVYISKVDVGGIEIDGGKYQFLDKSLNVIDEWIGKAGEPHKVKVSKGEYFLKEKASPNGYQILDKMIPVIVDENGKVMHIKVENNLIKNDIYIGKIDATDNKPLKGATLCFLNKDLSQYKSPYGEKICHISDGQNDYKYKNVPFGEYFIKETASPKGYEKLDKMIPVIINKQGQVQKIPVKNKPIKYVTTGGLHAN